MPVVFDKCTSNVLCTWGEAHYCRNVYATGLFGIGL